MGTSGSVLKIKSREQQINYDLQFEPNPRWTQPKLADGAQNDSYIRESNRKTKRKHLIFTLRQQNAQANIFWLRKSTQTVRILSLQLMDIVNGSTIPLHCSK